MTEVCTATLIVESLSEDGTLSRCRVDDYAAILAVIEGLMDGGPD